MNDTRSDRETLHAVLCEIGWADAQAAPGTVHVVALKPAAPPVRDVVVSLDEDDPRLDVRVRFLPPEPNASFPGLVAVLLAVNGVLRAGAFALDQHDGSVFFRHTLDLGERPLAPDDVRRTVLTALETVAAHAAEVARASRGRSVALAT
jgi:hypothetical protein